MASKSKLNEFSQRNGWRLPEYTYFREGGQDHCPNWICELNMMIEGEVMKFNSNSCSSKGLASAEAAQVALKSLKNFVKRRTEKEIRVLDPSYDHTFLLLDLENVPHAYRNLCEYLEFDQGKVHIFGFGSLSSPNIKTKINKEISSLEKEIIFIEAQSLHSDAADVKLVMMIAELQTTINLKCLFEKEVLNLKPEITFPLDTGRFITIPLKLPKDNLNFRIIIVTNDHFGKALVDILNAFPFSKYDKNIHWTTNIYHSIKEIST